MKNQNWDDLRVILTVARYPTLAGAASALKINESTVVRWLAQTEARYGTRLFQRVNGRFEPTDSGQKLVECATRVEIEIEGGGRSAQERNVSVSGKVRITSVPLIINQIIVPALPKLMNRYPELSIELIADARDLSLMKREADLALRLARPRNEARLLTRRVCSLDYGVYMSVDADEQHLPWISYEAQMLSLPQAEWIARRSGEEDQGPVRVLVNDAEVVLAGLQAGLGKSLLPTRIGDRLRQLRRVPGYDVSISREVWLLSHPELRNAERVRAVVRWITDIFSDRPMLHA